MSSLAAANLDIISSTLGALALGLMVGYERSYRGRAAGMRTYGLVCMVSCALTATSGYSALWFGHDAASAMPIADIGHIIQGIIAGIGFLGAGVIMREGMNISGLTTAASIWAVAVIGIVVGLGFCGAAIAMAIIAMIFMMWGSRIENLLPARHAIAIKLKFHRDAKLLEDDIAQMMHAHGYEVANGSFAIDQYDGQMEWRFVGVALDKRNASTFFKLSDSFRSTQGIQDFHISHARN